jgi:protein disulfide-isomerase A1
MFLHRVLHPAVIEADEHTAGSMTLLDDVVIMAHPHPDDSVLYRRFKDLAKQYRDRFSFVISSPIQASSALTCYNNLDDEKHGTSEVATVQALEDFVKLCSEPLIPELTRRNEAQYTAVRSNYSIKLTFSAKRKGFKGWLLLIIMWLYNRPEKAYCITLLRPTRRRRHIET